MANQSNNRIEVTTVRETPKALLVTAGAGEGWIQRRWLAADGTVSTTTLAKAIARTAERSAQNTEKRQQIEDRRRFENSGHLVRFTRETEKAIGCPIEVEFAGSIDTRLIWIPKSQADRGPVEGTAWCPGWLILKKQDEVCEKPGSNYYERHRWCKGEHGYIERGLAVASAI